MWVLILLFACQQEEEVEIQPPNPIVAANNFEIVQPASVDERLHSRYKVLLEQYGPARIAGKGLLVDEGWCHDYFNYSFVASRLVGLDFVKLASVQAREGIDGVNLILNHVPRDHEKYEDLYKIRQLIELTNDKKVRRSHELFKLFRNPNLNDQEQIDAWLLKFKEGFALRGGTSKPEEFLPEDFPKSYEISKLTNVDFQTLAFVELKGGSGALLLLMRTIPFWSSRDECFEIIRQD